jgi:hypothetical protein
MGGHHAEEPSSGRAGQRGGRPARQVRRAAARPRRDPRRPAGGSRRESSRRASPHPVLCARCTYCPFVALYRARARGPLSPCAREGDRRPRDGRSLHRVLGADAVVRLPALSRTRSLRSGAVRASRRTRRSRRGEPRRPDAGR